MKTPTAWICDKWDRNAHRWSAPWTASTKCAQPWSAYTPPLPTRWWVCLARANPNTTTGLVDFFPIWLQWNWHEEYERRCSLILLVCQSYMHDNRKCMGQPMSHHEGHKPMDGEDLVDIFSFCSNWLLNRAIDGVTHATLSPCRRRRMNGCGTSNTLYIDKFARPIVMVMPNWRMVD